MKTRGLAVLQGNAPLEPFEFERRALRPNDVALEITYAGICLSDIHDLEVRLTIANRVDSTLTYIYQPKPTN